MHGKLRFSQGGILAQAPRCPAAAPPAAGMLPLAAARRRYTAKQPPRSEEEAALARGVAAAARRRYTRKAPPRGPEAEALRRGIVAAIQAEHGAVDGLQALSTDARRRHIHYVLYRTENPADVQPSALTRRQVWAHISRCYREVYPRPAEQSQTGSILQFGLVAQERHVYADDERDRSLHYHVAAFANATHRWKQVRQLSSEKYGIHLHAVAHETYTTMYSYLRVPGPKKPLAELDPTPFYSPGHPQGDDLKSILELGEIYKGVRASRSRKRPAPGSEGDGEEGRAIRSQFASVYEWVMAKELRGPAGATQFHIDAVAELKAGRPHLLDFAKKVGDSLEDQLEFCWHVAEELFGSGQNLDGCPPWALGSM